MKHSRGFLLAVLLLSSSASASTSFTYQGRLDSSGQPYSGTVGIVIEMFDALTGGNKVGDTLTQSVILADGLFQLDLDFGTSINEEPRFLEITVNGQLLSPRQSVRAAPLATFSLRSGDAAYAENAENATQLGGVPASDFAVAADTQARVTGTCGAGEAISGINADGTVSCIAGSAGTITEVNAGTGLSGGGSSGAVSLSVDATAVQSRVTGTCPAGQAIRVISATGTVTCQAVGTITGVTAGTGLAGGGTSRDVTVGIANGGVTSTQIATTTVTEANLNLMSAGTVSSTTDEAMFSRYLTAGALSGVSTGRVMIASGGSIGRGAPEGGAGTATVLCGTTTVQTISLSGPGGRPWTYITPSFAISSCSAGDLTVNVRASSAANPLVIREIAFLPGL